MKISKKIFKFGTSCGIIIDKSICKELDLEVGEWVEINVKKVGIQLKGGKKK